MLRRIQWFVLLLSLPSLTHAQAAKGYTQSNLISDGSVKAQKADTQLVNPWGIAIGQQTPFWINTAGTGLSEVYEAGANKQFALKVPAAGSAGNAGSPTGIVFNPSMTDFALPGGAAALFVFATLDGTISAWNTNVTDAQIVADHSSSKAVYTGLAIVNNGTANYLLAANFAANKIDVFDAKFAPAALSGNFVDPAMPAGFAPFNVHVIKNQVFVTYAQQNSNGGSAFPPSAGTGYVSVFDNNGKFVARAISGGHLDAPWGLALAPSTFGEFGGDLLVANFGDGTISAYDPSTFVLKGQLNDPTGAPIQTEALWEIVFGAGGTGDPNTLYFSAGVNHEKGGLFGAITAATAPGAGDFAVSLAQAALTVKQGGTAAIQVNILPSNGFASPVSLTVSGLPNGATFQFSPTSVTPGAGAATSATLTITAGTYTAPGPNPYSVSNLHRGRGATALAAGALFPAGLWGMLPLLRNRRRSFKSFTIAGGAFLLIIAGVLLSGCGGTRGGSVNPNPTPIGTSMVTITATSGSLTHTTMLSLTVQ